LKASWDGFEIEIKRAVGPILKRTWDIGIRLEDSTVRWFKIPVILIALAIAVGWLVLGR
jgi:hypothetical protein